MNIYKILFILNIVLGYSIIGYATDTTEKIDSSSIDLHNKIEFQNNTLINLNKENYTFVYKVFLDVPNGVINSNQYVNKIIVHVKGGNVMKTSYLYRSFHTFASMIEKNYSSTLKTPFLGLVMSVITHKKDKRVYNITYDKQIYPQNFTFYYPNKEEDLAITNKIYIENYQEIPNDYVLDTKTEQLKEFNKYYKIWNNKAPLDYKLFYSKSEKNIDNNVNKSSYTSLVKDGKVKKVLDISTGIDLYDEDEYIGIKITNEKIDTSFTLKKFWQSLKKDINNSQCTFGVKYDYNLSQNIYLPTVSERCQKKKYTKISSISLSDANQFDISVNITHKKEPHKYIEHKGNYTFIYKIQSEESSADPDYADKIMVHIKNNKVMASARLFSHHSFDNLSIGMIVPPNQAAFLADVMDAIHGKKDMIYDKDGFPDKFTISNENMSSYTELYFKDYQEVNISYILDATKERIKEWDSNYKKWHKQKISTYQIEYTHSKTYLSNNKIDKTYEETLYSGLVKNNNIVQFSDIQQETGLSHNNYIWYDVLKHIDKKPNVIMTVEELFKYIKQNIKQSNCNFSVIYNKSQGYPRLINKVCKKNKEQNTVRIKVKQLR